MAGFSGGKLQILINHAGCCVPFSLYCVCDMVTSVMLIVKAKEFGVDLKYSKQLKSIKPDSIGIQHAIF